jgi:hypothetical protein
MQSRQANMLRSLRNVEEFLTANATTLNGIVNSGTRRKLANAIAVLETVVGEQAGTSASAQGETSQYHALRKVLIRDHMAPIARIASAELPPTPQMSALRMPRPVWKMERLAAAARGMGQVAEPLAATFVEAGLSPEFVARLDAAIDAMVRSHTERAQTRGRLSGATKDLAHTLASSRKLVNVIDALVTTALVHEPGLLRSWKVVKRVRRLPIHAADAPSPTPVVLPSNANVPGSALPAPRTASQSAA